MASVAEAKSVTLAETIRAVRANCEVVLITRRKLQLAVESNDAVEVAESLRDLERQVKQLEERLGALLKAA